jgi:hypothetical protein
VPNKGLNGKYLDSLAKKGQSNVHFLDGLKEGSELLRNAHREFWGEFQCLDCQIAFFYEQRETAAVIIYHLDPGTLLHADSEGDG